MAKRSSSNWAWYLHTSSSPLDYRKTHPIHLAPAHKLNTQDSIGGYQIIAMLKPASLQRPIHLHSFLAVNRRAAAVTTPRQHQNNAKMAMDPDLANSSKNDTMHGPSGSLGYVDQALIIWLKQCKAYMQITMPKQALIIDFCAKLCKTLRCSLLFTPYRCIHRRIYIRWTTRYMDRWMSFSALLTPRKNMLTLTLHLGWQLRCQKMVQLADSPMPRF